MSLRSAWFKNTKWVKKPPFCSSSCLRLRPYPLSFTPSVSGTDSGKADGVLVISPLHLLLRFNIALHIPAINSFQSLMVKAWYAVPAGGDCSDLTTYTMFTPQATTITHFPLPQKPSCIQLAQQRQLDATTWNMPFLILSEQYYAAFQRIMLHFNAFSLRPEVLSWRHAVPTSPSSPKHSAQDSNSSCNEVVLLRSLTTLRTEAEHKPRLKLTLKGQFKEDG